MVTEPMPSVHSGLRILVAHSGLRLCCITYIPPAPLFCRQPYHVTLCTVWKFSDSCKTTDNLETWHRQDELQQPTAMENISTLLQPSWLWIVLPLIVAVAWFAKQIYDSIPPRLNFPVVGSPDDKDMSRAIIEGTQKASIQSQRTQVTVLLAAGSDG